MGIGGQLVVFIFDFFVDVYFYVSVQGCLVVVVGVVDFLQVGEGYVFVFCVDCFMGYVVQIYYYVL